MEFLFDVLEPYEVFRHPECRRVSTCIHSSQTNRIIVYGPSGSGTSMFVNAHADIYWDKKRTKRIIADDVMTTTELLDTYPGVREGSYQYVIIDLVEAWSKNVLKNFFKKVPSSTHIVIISPEYIQHCIEVNTTDANENYTFLEQNKSFFKHICNIDSLQFYKQHDYFKCNLARLMQHFLHGGSFTDDLTVDVRDPSLVRTYIDAYKLFNVRSQFDMVSECGKHNPIEWFATLADIQSLTSIRTLNIFGTEEQTENTFRIFKAQTWYCTLQVSKQ